MPLTNVRGKVSLQFQLYKNARLYNYVHALSEDLYAWMHGRIMTLHSFFKLFREQSHQQIEYSAVNFSIQSFLCW